MRVLLVDDDVSIAKALSRYLNQAGFQVLIVTDPRKAVSVLSAQTFEAIVSDVDMPQMSGPDLLKAVSPDLSKKFIFYTGGPFGSNVSKLAELSNIKLRKGVNGPQDVVAAIHGVVEACQMRDLS